MMDTTQTCECKKLCACRLALAIGIVWGLGCGILGVITIYTPSYGHQMVEVLGSIYWGYQPGSWGGALAGLACGFVDGFVGTLVVVAIYRMLRGCGSCCCRKASSCQTPTGGSN